MKYVDLRGDSGIVTLIDVVILKRFPGILRLTTKSKDGIEVRTYDLEEFLMSVDRDRSYYLGVEIEQTTVLHTLVVIDSFTLFNMGNVDCPNKFDTLIKRSCALLTISNVGLIIYDFTAT